MRDVELYQQLLGITQPWSVSSVELDQQVQEVRVRVEHPRGAKFCCPECRAELPCHDHVEERRWRHLDTMQFKTILIARQPRVDCPEHGVKIAPVPWAEKNSRFTILFERFAIDVLLMTQTVQGAEVILRASWDEVWHILWKAVRRGRSRKQVLPLPRIGLDEKAFRKGQDYMTLLYDLDRSTVEAIADGSDVAAGNACFSQLTAAQIASIEAVAMDMSAAYVQSTHQNVPLAEQKIVHDRFHVMKMANEAVDKIRRGEHRQLQSVDDQRLKGTKYLWITGQENLTDPQRQRFDQVFSRGLETGKAWGYKELLRDLWHHDDAASATVFFKDWYRRVIHTKMEPLKKVARAIQERLTNVVSYCTHRITNAVAEGLNSKIMSIKRRVGGFRNPENYKTAIFFHCGGLDLYPQ